MYTAAALLDMHARAHGSVRGLMTHLGTLESGLLLRALDGFGFPTLLHQLTHALSAEAYWVGVLEGRLPESTDEPPMDDLVALEALRSATADATAAYLARTSDEALGTPRVLRVWGGAERALMPARVIVRTVTHLYDHKGQVAAMCRQLGHPIPRGLDFPLT
jgi:uncharacterized damage-inducible protein DinB